MALKGDIKFWKTIDDPSGATEIRTVQVPMDIAEDDPLYEHRGTKVEQEVPVTIEVLDEELSMGDVYLVIASCGFSQHKYDANNKFWYLSIIYHVYLSEEDRQQNNEPHQHADWTDMEFIDITSHEFLNTDIVTYAYNKLKSKQPFREMIDV